MPASLKFDQNILTAPVYNRGMTTKDLPAHVDPKKMIQMSSNENPLGTSPKVVEAVQKEAVRLSVYPPVDGDYNLRAALAEMHGDGITPEHLVAGNGGLDILNLIAQGFVRPGDEIITFAPTFHYFKIASARLGAKIVQISLNQTDFEYDVDEILRAVSEKTKLLYLCNPNNPTGNVLTSSEMERLVHGLPAHVMILSDEVYRQFVDEVDFPNTTPYIHAGMPLIQVFSFSKAFGLAGLRLGYGIARPEVADYLSRLRHPFHLGRLTITAGIAAVQDQAHLQKTVQTMISGRGWLIHQIRELGIKVWDSQGNFILFSTDMPALELTNRFLQYGIAVSDGARRFQLPTAIRITVGLPHQNQRFIEVLAKILEEEKLTG